MENKKENFNDVKYSFGVTGMACVSCSGRVEQKLKSIAGIKYAAINVSTERGFVIAEPRITLDLIKKAVIETGYGFSEKSDIAADETAYLREMKNILISSLIPAVFLMILMIFHYAGVHIPYMKTIEIVCGLFSFFVAGRKILKSAYIAVVHFHANMDVLISLSSLCALSTYFLSFLNDKIISFAYLSTMLITIHIIGKYIESSLKFKVSNDVRKLIGIQNNLASLIKENEILQVDVESVKKGDEILIKQGERILLDGIMIKGEPCYLDESLISGESTPVLKKTGDNIIAGSVSVSGIFHLKVEKTGKDTFLKQIIKLIEESQSSKIPIQAFADKLTLIFIPSIFAVSILSALAWFIFFNELIPYQIKLSEYFFWISPAANRITASIFIFISALVIACPCAIGLAIPMALASASGIAARRGLIIKNAETIQTSKDIDYIFLDKTGTITEGKPEVIEYGVSKEIFSIIASLEKRSEHPLAKSICGFAEEKSFFSEYGFEKVQETAGEGIKGILNNTEYFAGKPLNPESYSETLQKGRIVIEIRVNNQ
nr:cation-translocating P-type ATPase [bacterium]